MTTSQDLEATDAIPRWIYLLFSPSSSHRTRRPSVHSPAETDMVGPRMWRAVGDIWRSQLFEEHPWKYASTWMNVYMYVYKYVYIRYVYVYIYNIIII